MCKYCRTIFTGDYSDYSLTNIKVSMNKLNDLFEIDTYLGDDDDKKVYIYTDFNDLTGRLIAQEKMQIQYCPVCGRKLEKSS